MAWEHLSINKPHLVYIILGGFTSIFMLCSLFIKEKLYIGEATVATICGVIFGPHAANLINPLTWGNTDQVTLEFSRIVLVVQCFAVGVELPKAYMERHWKSVVFLLVPVMTFGWLITSLFIWWMIEPLTWLESLVCAACVTATDPVLASSVVGKGKFAKRVPKHLRDLLSAESGCNDGMAFPFVYLSVYLLRYDLGGKEVVYHWVCFTILYECIFGAFFGVMVGYIGRHAIKWAERKQLIDRESFLVFYFVLALFCAGAGSLLGMDDLLIGFAAGVGFSNDGWFTEKTEESHVSNVIDLLINLTYFVYFGTIIPWDQFNAPDHGMVPWRLVVIAIFVIFFRRLPIMLALKPFIPDVKTWREAFFAGHFGPIGVGAIFVAILARAELETDSTEPLATLPPPGSKDYNLIYLVWPVTTFLVISSILVHGSSIAVFTLGKRINTLTITLSYTQDNEKGPAWMTRLPRITSQSRSMSRMSGSDIDENEKLEIPPGELPPVGIPKLHLRRQREDEYEKKPGPRSSSTGRARRRRRRDKDSDTRLGGPISQSAIAPARHSEPTLSQQESGSDTLFEKSEEPTPELRQDRLAMESSTPSPGPEDGSADQEHEPGSRQRRRSRSVSEQNVEIEAYQEGDVLVVEDEEGNVVDTIDTSDMTEEEKVQAIEKTRTRLRNDTSGQFTKHKHEPHPKDEGEEIEREIDAGLGQPSKTLKSRFDQWKGFGRKKEDEPEGSGQPKQTQRRRGPAHAYQFGNTIIVEDEDGEVIKTYTMPSEGGGDRRREQYREGLRRMSTWVGLGKQAVGVDPGKTGAEGNSEGAAEGEGATKNIADRSIPEGLTDDGLRMIISRSEQYGLTGLQKKARDAPGTIALGSGRRLSTADFIKQMQQMDAKSRAQEVEQSDAPEELKREVRKGAAYQRSGREQGVTPGGQPANQSAMSNTGSTLQVPRSQDGQGNRSSSPRDADDYFSVQTRPRPDRMTSSDRTSTLEEESEDDEADIPTHNVQTSLTRHGQGQTAADIRRRQLATIRSNEEEEAEGERETAAEKRRRLAALGIGGRDDSSSESDDDNQPRIHEAAVPEPGQEGPSSQPKVRIQWGGESGRERQQDKQEETKEEDMYAGDPIVGAARKLRGMLKNRNKPAES
ncbi:CPA1 family monovalent cation:H+ antiporter [Exophiala aquamarina CBS 119918]|uniref:CPA1 family monovalent cation:H+ antiporter n=1 Tax=Exophiala aquamarina CBS 119918 TaxID=1182545 RepID=A0A072P714_9EURO|nr:CPA1 family monovalent cation:H+ antiporter [Exophiala aquamarina CBS 119918]KEF55517.1 CPA1 family monovalent cation:H+ antiporter [Exophiala aquamarina CBS 119918]